MKLSSHFETPLKTTYEINQTWKVDMKNFNKMWIRIKNYSLGCMSRSSALKIFIRE
jgi:hypothetical protein